MYTSLQHRVANRYITAASMRLEDWGLEGLMDGSAVTLYHGTTATFTSFDIAKTRKELVDKFYGGVAVFLTPKSRIAADYAYSARNTGFSESIVDDLKQRNPKAGLFLDILVSEGHDAWDKHWTPEILGIAPEDYWDVLKETAGGCDPNDLASVAQWVIGTNMKDDRQGDDASALMSLLTGGSVGGTPSYMFDTLDEIGLDSSVYRPKVYKVSVSGLINPMLTKSRGQAQIAKKKGYDSVVWFGADLVGNVPEVVVFDTHKIKIVSVEVL